MSCTLPSLPRHLVTPSHRHKDKVTVKAVYTTREKTESGAGTSEDQAKLLCFVREGVCPDLSLHKLRLCATCCAGW